MGGLGKGRTANLLQRRHSKGRTALPPLEVIVGGSTMSVKGEDSSSLHEEVTVAGESLSFIVVADGHGSREVSTYITTHMVGRIVTATTGAGAAELDKAAKSAFRQIDKEVCEKGTSAGSTCTVCCINSMRHEVSTWNVGDSLAMMVYDGGYRELGQTHRLQDNHEEQERVLMKGARLGRAIDSNGLPGGPLRAYPGGLAVVRCIGDSDCKQFVTAEPAFSTCQAPPQGGAVIACSDGVWEHLTAEDVATCILSGGYLGGAQAARQLVEAAIEKSPENVPTDDTSATILVFGPKPESGDIHEDHLAAQNPFVAARRPSGGTIDVGDSVQTHLKRRNSWRPEVDSPSDRSTRSTPSSSPSEINSRFAGVSVKGGVAFANLSSLSSRGAKEVNSKNEIKPTRTELCLGSTGVLDISISGKIPRSVEPRKMMASPANLRASLSPMLRRRNKQTDTENIVRSSSKGGTMKGGFSTMFDSILRTHSTSKELEGSKDRRSIFGRSFGNDSLTRSRTKMDRDILMSSGKRERLPWQARGVNTDSFTSTAPDGQGWAPRRSALPGWQAYADASGPSLDHDGLPLPPPAMPMEDADEGKSADDDLVDKYTRVHGSMPPARVIQWDDLNILKYLGQGEFAMAYATKIENENVAVKMLKPEKCEVASAVTGLKREIMLMTLMVHPNVLRAWALGEHEEKPFMVLSVLTSVLSNDLPKSADEVTFWKRNADVKKWPLTRALNYGVQLARAIKYCHDDAFPGYRVIHRDIKPNNIGFVGPHQLVLFDFGLASLWKHGNSKTDNVPRALTGETGSYRYMAPEVAVSKPYSHRSEVFSFATILWEMAAHQRPYSQFFSEEPFKRALASGVLPKVQGKWPAELKSILADCWQLDEGARPEFRTLLPRIESFHAILLEEAAKKATKKKTEKIAKV